MNQDLFSFPFEKISNDLLCKATSNENSRFRENQLEAILAIVRDRQKLLLVERTGWGKSMVYFIATKILRNPEYVKNYLKSDDVDPGPSIIISPLLALMRNQIYSSTGILKMASINSDQDESENYMAQQKFLSNDLDILIVSPERLSNDEFMENALMPMASKISLMIVDEAHCISDWGHDFRPDYKRIKNIISNLPPQTPLLATTATANSRVIEDVSSQIGQETLVMRGQLTRDSLRLRTKISPSTEERLSIILSDLKKMKESEHMYGGIVYTLTIKDCERVKKWLEINEIKAAAYHSDVETNEKLKIEEQLMSNNIDVVVATSALSMGFDKPDLGFVYHFQTPQSVVHYYQQVGRAGRAIPEAFGTCFRGIEDSKIVRFFIDKAFPDPQSLTELVSELEKESSSVYEIQNKVNLKKGEIEKCLKILSTLENPPIIKEGNLWIRTPNAFTLDKEEINKIRQLRIKEWEEINSYIDANQCLMKFLANSLGDDSAQECGKCSFCTQDYEWSQISDQILISAKEFLKKLRIPLLPRKSWMQPNFQIWEHLKGRIKDEHMAEEGVVMCHLTDNLYGERILDGKRSGFDNIIVDSAAKCIKDKWPNCRDFLIVSVPSSRSESVKHLSKEISVLINSSYSDCIRKIRRNEPQKDMQNSSFQKMNLDGVFEVISSDKLRGKKVLLIDDVVSSRWTFTVIAALLKDAGAEKVYPFALASANSDSIVEQYLF